MVFRNELNLLKKNGIDVIAYEKHNDDIRNNANKLTLALNTIWSTKTYREIADIIRKEKPDVAHFHNIWYQISPSAYYACKDAGVPVVQTLHNFRMFCANGLLLREGTVCEACLGKVPWRSACYGCYRNSRLYSFPVALTEWIHSVNKTWQNAVDVYIALTEFGKSKAIQAGLPPEKVFVKPNFLMDPPKPTYSGAYAVFLGRLSSEKGSDTLLKAFQLLNDIVPLKIVGDGLLLGELNHHSIPGVEFMGRKSLEDCIEILRGALFLIMPSIWYEGFPMVIREAFACGKPVIASNLGAMASIVEHKKTGLLFEPGNAKDLASKIRWMIDNPDACTEMGKNARAEFEAKYTAERNFELLIDIYKKAIIIHKESQTKRRRL